MTVAALLSGGVDSSVVVHLLNENGTKPDLFYIKIGRNDDELLHCSSEEDMEMAKAIAKRYGNKLTEIDLHRQYWDTVVDYTIRKVRSGLTPNPDVMCNKLIKFGVFEQCAGKNYDKTATGHYATTTEIDNKIFLSTAKDTLKDQTDFLAQIDTLQVQKLIFPIGNLMKSQVRQIATKVNLPSSKRPDSQGICFLGKVNYNDFIRRYLGENPGPIVEFETGRILGHHKGYWFHTVGQRKGLCLSGGPWYVVKKDIEANIIYTSKGYGVSTQYGTEFTVCDFNFIAEQAAWAQSKEPKEITFKIRHTPEFTEGTVQYLNNNRFLVKSQKPLQGISAGQFGVIYDKEHKICYGSGEISTTP
ncbi:MAG: tRNA 2-thiouridine(34) synthase MnmA [Paludibacter sp.]|nr:tRNA 2-thiouridine(34) synthase MnmA [Paludibacter sp.]